MSFGPFSPFRPLILSSVDGTLRTESDSRTGTGHRTLPLDAMSLLTSESSTRMLMGQRGQARTPGQGQDSGDSIVLLKNVCVAAYSALRRSRSWRNFFNSLLCVASQLLMAKLFPLLLLLVASDDAADAEYTFDAVEHFLSEIAFYFATRQTLVGRNR